MITLSDQTVIRQLNVTDMREAIRRRIVLEAFLAVRKATAERVSETKPHPTLHGIQVTTYMSYDAAANLICEDVVIEPKPAVEPEIILNG